MRLPRFATEPWGGARTGAGRKPAPQRAEVVSVRLLPDEIEQLKALGSGSIRDGIRIVLQRAAGE
jgi:hypothetical protein